MTEITITIQDNDVPRVAKALGYKETLQRRELQEDAKQSQKYVMVEKVNPETAKDYIKRILSSHVVSQTRVYDLSIAREQIVVDDIEVL